MAQLLVRDVDEKLVRALKLRAASMGRSAEAEHRELLKAALLGAPAKSFKEFLASMPDLGDGLPKRSKGRARRVRL
jgi:plasmid stability protein